MSKERNMNMLPVVGNIHLRAFISFLANQLTWQNTFTSAQHNEQNCLLWIRAEPQNAATFIAQHQRMISDPEMKDHVRQLQAVVLRDYQHYVRTKAPLAVKENNLFWENCLNEKQEYHPYNPPNLQAVLSRVPYYVRCMQYCAENWIGYKFKFPILWLSGEQYKGQFGSSKKEEAAACRQIQTVCGFRDKFDATSYNYCVSNLHRSSQYSDSDS